MFFFDVQAQRDSRAKFCFAGVAAKWFFTEISRGYFFCFLVRAARAPLVAFFNL
jgi:hypothetical protein